MTDGERKLWAELREFRRLYNIHVRRQAPVGPYIADFAVHERRIVIEVDGEHHTLPQQYLRDRQRDCWFAAEGYTVLRFSTGELWDSFDGCIEEILTALGLMETAAVTPDSTEGAGSA